MELPRGCKFHPSDEDCLFYLKEKISGNPMPFQGMILDLNPFDDALLPDILAAADYGDLYIFTRLGRKAGRITYRSVGKGYWHGDSKTKKIIRDEHGSVIGLSRVLRYWERIGSGTHKRFRMTEYLMPSNGTCDIFKDWVLLRLVKKDGRKVCKSATNSAASSPRGEVDATLSEIPPDHQILAASENEYEELLNKYLNEIAYENYDDPIAADSGFADYPHICEVEATPINFFQLSTSVEIPSTRAQIDIEHGNNQTMAYHSYANEVEATPNLINFFPLSTAVEIPLPQSAVDFEHGDEELYSALMAMEDGDHEELYSALTTTDFEGGDEELYSALMAMESEDGGHEELYNALTATDFEDCDKDLYSAFMAMDSEDENNLVDWTVEPFNIGEECWTALELFPW